MGKLNVCCAADGTSVCTLLCSICNFDARANGSIATLDGLPFFCCPVGESDGTGCIPAGIRYFSLISLVVTNTRKRGKEKTLTSIGYDQTTINIERSWLDRQNYHYYA